MFIYEKKLQYPVRIRNTNPALAKFIISQYGGPDGELGASLRYLSQRYSMPYPELKGLLTDIGTEASEMFRSAECPEMISALQCRLPGSGYRTRKGGAVTFFFCKVNHDPCSSPYPSYDSLFLYAKKLYATVRYTWHTAHRAGRSVCLLSAGSTLIEYFS